MHDSRHVHERILHGGAPLTCDDLDVCTANSCDSMSGCAFAPIFECCGDGVIEGVEECDDADLDADDGCSETCTIEPGFACSGEPSLCYENSLPISDWMAPLLALLMAGLGYWGLRETPSHES
jgi:cysteine-rich repeat protein